MKEFIKPLRRDRTLFLGYFFSSILILLLLGYSVFYYKQLPPFLPLFNQLPWGEERLGEQVFIFIPAAIATAVLGINLTSSSFLYSKIPLIARILSITSLLISFLAFLFVFRTIQLII